MVRIAFIALFLALLVAGCTGTNVDIEAGSSIINAEIADSPDKWSTGLMNRQSLAENTGMLFVFPDSAPRSFWMKNTLIPLDIIFIDEKGTVINIEEAEPCKADPCRTYQSERNARYVLEVNMGYSKLYNITKGMNITIPTTG